MDHGWIVTFAADSQASPQVSVATEGGSGMPVPDLSIEVDNFEDVHAKLLKAGYDPVHGPVSEPWDVRPLSVRDPFGTLVNILSHD